jgi:predicted nucleotidyltransferase
MSEQPRSAPVLAPILQTMLDHGVDFVLVGGLAGIAQGSSYPSFDVDIAYARDRGNMGRLVGALEEIGVSLRNAPADLPFQLEVRTFENGANFTFSTKHGDLDLLGDIKGVRSYEDLRAASELKVVAGIEVRVASIDFLIAMKRAANRTKDKLMVEEYIVIADEQERARRAAGDS